MPQVRREVLERALQGYLVVIPHEGYIVVYPEYEMITIVEVQSREELEELLGRARFRGVRGVCTASRRLECTELEVEGRTVLEVLYMAEAY